jgi:hypothetical protein
MKGLEIRIRCELDEFFHETMAMAKCTINISINTRFLMVCANLWRAAGQIRLRAFFRKGW